MENPIKKIKNYISKGIRRITNDVEKTKIADSINASLKIVGWNSSKIEYNKGYILKVKNTEIFIYDNHDHETREIEAIAINALISALLLEGKQYPNLYSCKVPHLHISEVSLSVASVGNYLLGLKGGHWFLYNRAFTYVITPNSTLVGGPHGIAFADSLEDFNTFIKWNKVTE